MQAQLRRLILVFCAALPVFAGEVPSTPPPATAAFISDLKQKFETFGDWSLTQNRKTDSRSLSCEGANVWDLRSFRTLTIRAACRSTEAVLIHLRWRITSKAGGLYEVDRPVALSALAPVDVQLPLTPEAGTLIPVGHQRPWDDLAAAEVTALELQAEWRAPYVVETAPITLSQLALESRETAPITPKLLDLELSAVGKNSRAKAVLSFRIEPPPADPFAVEGAGDVRVIQPDGTEVLAWLDQKDTGVNDGSAERSIAVGHSVWRAFVNSGDAGARFQIRSGSRTWSVRGLPLMPAAELSPETHYRWQPELRIDGPEFPGALSAFPPARVLDGHGVWLAAPELAKGAKHWRPVPFWNAAWNRFDGFRAVNFADAQRLDAELDALANEKTALPLDILPGETLGVSGPFNWHSHLLREQLATRGAVCTDAAALAFYQRWMRYCIARYGASRAVRNFAITTALNAPEVAAFHVKLAEWLSTLPHDPDVPIVSTDPLAVPFEETGAVENFEKTSASPLVRWHADLRVQRASVALLPAGKSGEPASLEIKAYDPAATALAVAGTYQFGAPRVVAESDGLTFDLFVPQDAPPDLRAGVHLCTLSGDWFDAVFSELLRPGEWNRFVLDLTAQNRNALHCVTGAENWSEANHARLSELGIHCFSTHPSFTARGKVQVLTLRVGPIRGIRFRPTAGASDDIALSANAARTWPPETLQALSNFDARDMELLNPWQADGRLGKASGASLYRAGPDNKTCFEVRATDAKTLAIGAVGRYLFGTAGDFSNADTLVYDLWIPANAPPDLRTGIHFVDQDGRWVETVLQAPPMPGEWTTFAVDLTSANVQRIHAFPADEQWKPGAVKRFFEVGVHLFSTHPNWIPRNEGAPLPLSLRVANIRAVRALPHTVIAPQVAETAPRGAPTRVASLSDTKPAVYAWFADERTGSPCNGQITVNEGFTIFTLTATQVNPKSLCLTAKDSGRAAHWDQPANDNLFSADALVFQVWCPAEQPPGRVGVHFRDRNGLWFETLLPGTLIPNEWTTYGVDLTGSNVHQLKAVGHVAPWTDYSRQRVGELGIHIFPPPNSGPPSKFAFETRVRDVHTVAFESIQPRKSTTITLFDPEAQKELPPGGAAAKLTRGDLWECHALINRTFENPFDPRDCDLTALVTTPSGKEVRVPAFFNQLCRRHESKPGGDEIVEPFGPEFFTVRFRATEAGPHRVCIELHDGGKYEISSEGHNRVHFTPGPVAARLDLANPAFVVGERPAGQAAFHGFMRCAADKRHFEFEDGTFFYPIGPCLRSPSDTRVPYIDHAKWNGNEIARIGRRGTYQYDDYMAEAAKNGVSWARVWMCSWWGGLEWRRDWPGFQGLGRYNLLNAWRIDHVLDLAEKYGIEINLCLTNHGQFAPNVDSEWGNNPYGSSFGGPLQAPREFFTRPEAKILHENKLRYVVARYGHSPAVMAWALFSECEFTQEYGEHENNSPNVCDWHAEMANFLKDLDPNKHLVTSHFSHPHHGIDVLAIPEMDFATSNAYSAFGELTGRFDAAEALASYWGGRGGFKGFIAYNKPALVEEQGRHFMGGNANTKENLNADLHAGIWGSLVQPLSGATGYWWWLHLHFDQKWKAYKPFADFMKGEDLRPAPGEKVLEPAELTVSNAQLHARALRSADRLYVWVYHNNMPINGETNPVAGATVQITDLRPGNYHVQFWNTYSGEIIKNQQITVSGSYTLALPVVDRDLAIKILP